MICKNCSHENAPEEKVCSNCGMPLTEEEAAIISEEEISASAETEETVILGENDEIAEGIEESIEEEIEEIEDAAEAEEIEEVAEAEDSVEDEIVIENDVEEVAFQEEAPKKKSKLFAFSGLIALVVICIGLWITFTGILAPKYDIPVDRSKFAISYIKDGALYQKPVSGQTAKVSEALAADPSSGFNAYSYTIKQSKDGKITYFLENFDTTTFSGTLYVTYDGRSKEKIADNVVQGFVVSENGKTVVYMSALDVNTATGQLYYYTRGLEPQLIANNTLYQTYMVSTNGEMIGFMENVDPTTGIGEYYTVKTGRAPVKIDDAVMSGLEISDNGQVIYLKNMNETTYTFDLYIASQNKTPEFVSSGVTENYVMPSGFSDKLAYVTVDENQTYSFSAKNAGDASTVVLDDLMGFFAVDIENENYLLAKMGEGADAASGMPDMLLKKKGQNIVTIATNMMSPQHASASYDFKTIYYLGEYDETTSTGTLHVRKEGFFGNASDEIIATGVSSFNATKNGKAVAYTTDLDATTGVGTLNVYKDGNSKVIADNVFSSLFTLSDNGKTITYISDLNMQTYIGNLYRASTTGSSGSDVIDTEVYASFYSRSDKNAIYRKNYNTENGTADLYIWKGNGTPELIDTGVAAVLFE